MTALRRMVLALMLVCTGCLSAGSKYVSPQIDDAKIIRISVSKLPAINASAYVLKRLFLIDDRDKIAQVIALINSYSRSFVRESGEFPQPVYFLELEREGRSPLTVLIADTAIGGPIGDGAGLIYTNLSNDKVVKFKHALGILD